MSIQNILEYFYEIALISYRYFRLSIFPILFLVSVYYFIYKSDNRNGREISIYSLIAIIFSINPIIYSILLKFVDYESYYRIYWISFIPLIISLFLTELQSHPSKVNRLILYVTLLSIIVTGKLSYLSNDFSFSDNLYKLNNSVIKTSEFIMSYEDDNEIIVLCSNGFDLQVRQYEPRIKLINAQYQVNQKNEEIKQLSEAVNQEQVNLYPFTSLIQSLQIDFIILNTNQKMMNSDFNGIKFISDEIEFQIYKVVNQ